MATVAKSSISRKVQHYASFIVDGAEVYGVATLVPGGYSFRPDGTHSVRLVSYTDADLLLYGRVDLADRQHEADKAQWEAAGFAVWQEAV